MLAKSLPRRGVLCLGLGLVLLAVLLAVLSTKTSAGTLDALASQPKLTTTSQSVVEIYELDGPENAIDWIQIGRPYIIKLIKPEPRPDLCVRVWGRISDGSWSRLGQFDGKKGEFHVPHTSAWPPSNDFQVRMTSHTKGPGGECDKAPVFEVMSDRMKLAPKRALGLFTVQQQDRNPRTDDVPWWGWLLIGMGIAISVLSILALIGWLCDCLCFCCCCRQ